MACVYFSEELKLTQFGKLGEFNSNAALVTLGTNTLHASHVRETGMSTGSVLTSPSHEIGLPQSSAAR